MVRTSSRRFGAFMLESRILLNSRVMELLKVTRPHKKTKNKRDTGPSNSYTPIRDPRWWAIVLVSGFGAYAASSHGLFFYGAAWQVPLFVGCVIGLLAVAPVQAALLAPIVMAVSLVVIPPPIPLTGLGLYEYALGLSLSTGAATAIAYVRTSWTGQSRKYFGMMAAAGLVVWTLVNLWLPLLAAGLPVSAYGSLPAAMVTEIPQPGTYVLDDEIYRRIYYLMHQGEPYYAAFNDAWRGLQTSPPLPDSVLGFRLPLLFWTWNLLPPDPFFIVYLYLALCSVGVVSAAFITGQLVGVRFAPLAAVAVAAYAMGIGIYTYIVYVDMPAMSIALAGIALFIRAIMTKERSTLWAAAGVMTLAALTREILVYLVVLAALSALLENPAKRLRAATPWLAALGVFALGYTAHSIAVWGYLSEASRVSYFGGGLGFLASGLTEFSDVINGHGVAITFMFVAGVAGAFAVRSRTGWQFSAFAAAALLLPVLAWLRIGNSGINAVGDSVNTWGMLVVPFALALWPTWALLLQRSRR